MPKQLPASTVSNETTEIIKRLEDRGYKPSEIMVIGLSVSEIAESIIHTQSFMAITANTVANMLSDEQ